jgi:hypothetical protein
MKTGDIVTIYEDPVTCQKIEGDAELLELLMDDTTMQYWHVRFKNGDHGPRWIKKQP